MAGLRRVKTVFCCPCNSTVCSSKIVLKQGAMESVLACKFSRTSVERAFVPPACPRDPRGPLVASKRPLSRTCELCQNPPCNGPSSARVAYCYAWYYGLLWCEGICNDSCEGQWTCSLQLFCTNLLLLIYSDMYGFT